MLKGLGMVCRFRFLFLEVNSEFHANNILTLAAAALPGLARNMLRELDLLMRAAVEADLDQPNDWSQFVDWDTIKSMSGEWSRNEPIVRNLAALLGCGEGTPEERETLRRQLAEAIEALADGIELHNRSLIEQMCSKLRMTVKLDHRRQAKLRGHPPAGTARVRHVAASASRT